MLLLLLWSLLAPRGQGTGRTSVWALLRARNWTWYLSFHLDRTRGPSNLLLSR